MKNRILLKSIGLFAVSVLSLLNISCDKDDERIDFYKSQNRSQELKGWWRSIDDTSENPHYMLFEELLYKSVSYSEVHGYYIPPEGDYWYNTSTHIHFLAPGNFKGSGTERATPFILNATKDTLSTYSNPAFYFVKSEHP